MKRPIRSTLVPSAFPFNFLCIGSSSKEDIRIRSSSEARNCWKVEWMGQVSSLLFVSHLKCWLCSYRRWMEGMLWKVKGKVITEKRTIRAVIQKTEMLWQSRILPLKTFYISLWTPLYLPIRQDGSLLWMHLACLAMWRYTPWYWKQAGKGS